MRDAGDVIAEVVNGHGPELAVILEVSKSRCYEILSTDNPYPKTKRLIRAIAQIKGTNIELIRADMNAMFDELCVVIDSLTKRLREEAKGSLCRKNYLYALEL